MKWLDALISVFRVRCGQNYCPAPRSDFRDLLYAKLFPTRTQQKNPGPVSWAWGKHNFCSTRYGDALLFLFLHSLIHRFYQRGTPAGGDILLLDFIPHG